MEIDKFDKFDKFGTKYSMHKIAHTKHWSDICVKAGLNDSDQCYQMNCIVCVLHTVEI